MSTIAGTGYLDGASPTFPATTALAVSSKSLIFTTESLNIIRMISAGAVCQYISLVISS